MQIVRERESARADLEQRHPEQKFRYAVFREEDGKKRERRRDVIRVYAGKLSAERTEPGVERTAVSLEDIPHRLKEVNVLTVQVKDEDGFLRYRIYSFDHEYDPHDAERQEKRAQQIKTAPVDEPVYRPHQLRVALCFFKLRCRHSNNPHRILSVY